MKILRNSRISFLHISDKELDFENTKDETWVSQYDAFVCGSDQIWNPFYATTSKLAFLSFASSKSIAFAPSFGVSSIPDSKKIELSSWIKKIDYLSVREEDGQKIIRELTGRNAEILLDPTMLLPQNQWNALSKKPHKELPEHYVVCYFLGMIDKKYNKIIQDFAKR